MQFYRGGYFVDVLVVGVIGVYELFDDFVVGDFKLCVDGDWFIVYLCIVVVGMWWSVLLCFVCC